MGIPTEPIGSKRIGIHTCPGGDRDSTAQRRRRTDDRGFAPFRDDVSTSRETAFAKIRARVAGTALASAALTGR